mmetsp:Transcript_105648/g.187862  ORF Transcript_105648/g.187862 Transcript_105648/m.187862 type:complete len:214 (-) Transcript_105648:359-1000(-)
MSRPRQQPETVQLMDPEPCSTIVSLQGPEGMAGTATSSFLRGLAAPFLSSDSEARLGLGELALADLPVEFLRGLCLGLSDSAAFLPLGLATFGLDLRLPLGLNSLCAFSGSMSNSAPAAATSRKELREVGAKAPGRARSKRFAWLLFSELVFSVLFPSFIFSGFSSSSFSGLFLLFSFLFSSLFSFSELFSVFCVAVWELRFPRCQGFRWPRS